MSLFNFTNDVKHIDEAREHLVFVRWLDHYSGDHDWTSIDSIVNGHGDDPDLICETCGFLIFEDDAYLKIAVSVNDNCELSTVFTVMKSSIIERIDFRV